MPANALHASAPQSALIEGSPPGVSSTYVKSLALDAMLGVVTVQAAGRPNLATIAFASEAAHFPTTMWVSLARSSLTHELVLATGEFAYSVLHDGQRGLALACGTASGRDKDKAAGVGMHRHAERWLFLDDSLTNVACRVRSATDLGDYTLFIADIVSGEQNSRRLHRRHLLARDL